VSPCHGMGCVLYKVGMRGHSVVYLLCCSRSQVVGVSLPAPPWHAWCVMWCGGGGVLVYHIRYYS
jgi:hypothetical protein